MPLSFQKYYIFYQTTGDGGLNFRLLLEYISAHILTKIHQIQVQAPRKDKKKREKEKNDK